ncbi:MAG: TIGR03960 family B12-binding radical SAM protein [Candidatus Cloacimonetes bacterium]|nr:TIGR03960 family B12-binding radical SAM protein [Candidatus Cloacimonadota bacterium]
MRYQKISYDHLLERVEKPGRYTDSEVNACHKQPSEEKICFCFAYPDVYEVGFSHQGIKILYSILNKEADTVADRVYAPWPDLGRELRRENILLPALESQAAIRDFDVLGFTLQSELTYTNILYILELGGIGIFRADRAENEPLVIAGGPCGSNPEPLAEFIDAFLIGDGEEAILEIKNCLRDNKAGSRAERLQALGRIEGVYVPEYYDKSQGRIKARKYMDFDNENTQADNQIVPWVQPTHDRFVAEIMRGCGRGCRFCHAGFFYRPVREKSPELVKKLIQSEVEKNGWEEVALTSLSSSDYTMIRPLLVQLADLTGCRQTKLSLPSLRVDSLDETLTGLMNDMQQKSITIAPEAGSQRLRDIINKNISETEILEGVKVALSNGWRVIKLYFMIGLPFEEWSDIKGIVELVEKIIAVAGRKLQINIAVSPFVPKPFTPFQWAKAESRELLLEKVQYLKSALIHHKFVKLKYHTLEYQAVECVLGRGDRQAGRLLYAAYKRDAIYDGWYEYFDYAKWQQAEIDSGVSIADYLREIDRDAALPWDYISIGVSRQYLADEYKKAAAGETTGDCRDECTGCGLCTAELKPVYHSEILPQQTIAADKSEPQSTKSFRVFYEKGKVLRYIGHLDMLRMTYRLVRASNLPIIYSEGFNRHPQVSFGPPLPLGMISECEYIDLKLEGSEITKSDVHEALERVFPPGMELGSVTYPVTKAMRSMEYYQDEVIILELPGKNIDYYQARIREYQTEKQWQFTRIRKQKEKVVDLKTIIREMEIDGVMLRLRKKVSGASIYDVLEHVFGIQRVESSGLNIRRVNLLK